MLSVYPSSTRLHERPASSAGSVWHSLGTTGDAPRGSFHGMTVLDENLLPPGSESLRRSRPAEVLTYVVEGALTWEDDQGGSGVLQAGEFQTSRRGEERESNASEGNWVSYFQIAFGPPRAPASTVHTQRHFTLASRRDTWRVVASPDGRDGSLRLDEDALVSSVIVELGQHVVYPLAPGRAAWLHVVTGRVGFGELEFSAGDGVSVTDAVALSVTARERSELLLIEVAHPRLETLS
jgi:redox-sensitive bicupin YhaK (pirin superfamily)